MAILRPLGLLLVLLLSASAAAQQPRYGLVADWPLTAEAGAENLLAAQRLTMALEDRFLPLRLWHEGTVLRKAGGIGVRLGRLVLLDYPLDHLTFLTQHEVFGHGARYREFGWNTTAYRIAPPWPYDDGSGFASYRIPEEGRTRDEVIVSALNGAHGSFVLASGLRRNAVQRGRLHWREAQLYLLAALDVPLYLLAAEEQPFGPAGDDALAWLANLNARADFEGVGATLTLEEAQEQAAFAFLDPLLYVSAWTVLKTYLYSGERSLDLPAVSVGSAEWLPALRFGWGPFGTELYLDNLVALDGRFVRLYGRRTDPALYAAWGAGAEVARLLTRGPLALDAEAHVWDQPPLRLDPTDRWPDGSLRTSGGGLGGAASVTAALDLPLRPRPRFGGRRLSVLAEAGYKTVGFVAGERLDRGPILRLGLMLTE
ncbi:MAG: hypothetical protein R3362_09950 [Rhodothermales bacterium]|nr:hypothetical protein [Rhodothermales bacterium]